MRYHFVGEKTPLAGKTLWEIVGNLKNFGVGRLVKRSSIKPVPELNLFRITKVQAVPPHKNEFVFRNVIVWIEQIFFNQKIPHKYTFKFNNRPYFHLIPKYEEQKYLERLQKHDPPKKYITKYCYWPPLYKKLWEKETVEGKQYEPIPKLECINKNHPGFLVIKKDEESKPPICSLYKGELTVEDMYKEIVRLKLLIKANAQS